MDMITVNGQAWVGKAIRSLQTHGFPFQTECQKQTFLSPDQSARVLYVSRGETNHTIGPLTSFWDDLNNGAASFVLIHSATLVSAIKTGAWVFNERTDDFVLSGSSDLSRVLTSLRSRDWTSRTASG